MKNIEYITRPNRIAMAGLAFILIVLLTNSIQEKSNLILKDISFGFYKSDIEFIKCKLNETFSPTVFLYTANVEKSYTSVVYITPELVAKSTGIIKINGNVARSGEPFKQELKPGLNSIDILVSSENGDSKNYKLNIIQEDLSAEYTSELVAPGVWRISDFGGFIGNENMYLIVGREKALLFDTGMGKGNLAAYIKTLTKLPVEVAITHSHGDHFRQVDQFRESTVYVPQKDSLPIQYLTPKFKWVNNGDIIDIGGGRRFEVCEIPGHTKGCSIFLDSKNKMAIIGDAVGSGSMVYMFTKTALLDKYVDAIRKVEEKIKGLDGLTLLTGHHYQEKTPLIGSAGKQYFTDMRITAEKVLSGELVGNPAYTVRNGVTTELRQAYYGLAGLWYNPKDPGIKLKL